MPGLRVLVHSQSNRPLMGSETHETKTWTFSLKEITIKVPTCTKIWIKEVTDL